MSIESIYEERIQRAIQALKERTYYAPFKEHPKAYPDELFIAGRTAFENLENKTFDQLLQTTSEKFIGEEVSPYTQEALGIVYPSYESETLVNVASDAFDSYRNTAWETRCNVLMSALDRLEKRLFEIGMATLHTTGQAFVMAFQAGGTHALDRAMETIALGVQELRSLPGRAKFSKPMGRVAMHLEKTFLPVPKGIGLVIACSTFPTWNSAPGIFANLLAGNTVIVKPHPKAVLPLAIFVVEVQNALKEYGCNPLSIQLAVDTSEKPIAKELAENPAVKLIDYTGGNAFGDYIESLTNKTIFTEKSGVNPILLHSTIDLRETMRNIAFSLCMYSGQMCTAPQNIFVPAEGVDDDGEIADFETVLDILQNEISSFTHNQKMAAGTMGAIQNEHTLKRVESLKADNLRVVLNAPNLKNPEFKNARVKAPTIYALGAEQKEVFGQEHFGPVAFVVRTKDIDHSVELAKKLAQEKGAITCSIYTTDEQVEAKIVDEMNRAFTPVSVNLTGFALVNQHTAFSDLHVSGGNPAGNATFTDSSFFNRRFVWIGNRKMV